MSEDPRSIAPSDLPRLAPKLKHYLRSSLPSWPDIADAADRLRRELGIPTALWEDACVAMGGSRQPSHSSTIAASTRCRRSTACRAAKSFLQSQLLSGVLEFLGLQPLLVSGPQVFLPA